MELFQYTIQQRFSKMFINLLSENERKAHKLDTKSVKPNSKKLLGKRKLQEMKKKIDKIKKCEIKTKNNEVHFNFWD
jgi:hypothetical protein